LDEVGHGDRPLPDRDVLCGILFVLHTGPSPVDRDQVRARSIVPAIARRGTGHGTGLGTYRRVVERTFARLHRFKRLRIRRERRAGPRPATHETTLAQRPTTLARAA
jgi:transposase